MQVTEADLMQAIAYPLPMRVIAEMLGIPDTMETWLLACTEVIARFFGAPNQHGVETLRTVERAVLELMHFFREATAARRKHKGNDLITTHLINASVESETRQAGASRESSRRDVHI